MLCILLPRITYKGYEYFKEPLFCDFFIETLELCKQIKQFELYAFNVLYEHVHLLLEPYGKYNISKIMKSLKENTSRDINYIISGHHHEGDTSTYRLRLRGIIRKYRKIFVQKHDENQYDIPSFKWQKSFFDHIIRDEQDFQNHYNYTAYNYLKHGLSEDWKYMSLNYGKMIDNI